MQQMFSPMMLFFVLALATAAVGFAAETQTKTAAATVVVATKNSSARARAMADFVGDGVGDQEEISTAIQSLPEVGGTVLLMEGTYDIRKVEGKLGGVIIDRSNVTLAGQGASTKLVLGADQNTNVVRIIGSGVGHVTVRDLYVDANRAENTKGAGDPKIGHDRFEFCGIKAYCRDPRGPAAEPNHNVTIRNCQVMNAHRLGLMLQGANMRVLDNVLGNAGSDSVELLTGPGIVRGNYVEITGQTHVAIGSDAADSIIMAENIVHVKKGGRLDIGFRSWAQSHRHVISNNVLVVDPGGQCTLAMDVRGAEAVVTGNNVRGLDPENRVRLKIGDGNTLVAANVLENVVIEIADETGGNKPIVLGQNILVNSTVDHKKGNLHAPAAPDR